MCPALPCPCPHPLLQAVKILRAYTPAMGLEQHVSPCFLSSVEVNGAWGGSLHGQPHTGTVLT